MNVFEISNKDFLNCWKALAHSERVFREAIDRKDFPNGSSEVEMNSFLHDIEETKEKIEIIIGMKKVEDRIH